MMLNPHEWLNEEVDIRSQFGFENCRGPRHEAICRLLYANGGTFRVGSWGCLSSDEYGHEKGLEMEGAISLMEYGAYMAGATDAGVDLFREFEPYMESYIGRVRQRPASVANGA